MKRSFQVVLIAAVWAISTTVFSPVVAHAASGVRYNVWTWNVSGALMNKGAVDRTKMTEVAVASILENKTDLASFNEICWGQYQDIQKRLRAAGWPQDPKNFSRFSKAGDHYCRYTDKKEPFGLAIFSRKPLGNASTTDLPRDPVRPNEARLLLCAPIVTPPSKHTFCTTHTTPSSWTYSVAAAELDVVRATLQARSNAGQRVIIAGDFNAEPNSPLLKAWYYSPSPKPTGKPVANYVEVDQTEPRCPGYGEGTILREVPKGSGVYQLDAGGPCKTGVKIDYIFVKATDLNSRIGSGDSLRRGTAACGGKSCSDHRIVIGTIDLKA